MNKVKRMNHEIKIITTFSEQEFLHPLWQLKIEHEITRLCMSYIILNTYVNEDVILDVIPSSMLSDTGLEECLAQLFYSKSAETCHNVVKQFYGASAEVITIVQETAQKNQLNICVQTALFSQQQKRPENTLKHVFQFAKKVFMLWDKLSDQAKQRIRNLGRKYTVPAVLLHCPTLDLVLFLTSKTAPNLYFSYDATCMQIGVFELHDDIYRINHVVPYYHAFPDQLPQAKRIQLSTSTLNILGDTYFGEAYTEKRKRQGRPDALQQYDYLYSFESIKVFLDAKNFNLVNFEAVFNVEMHSKYTGVKPYILGADTYKTLDAFKALNIHAVCLANNHLNDYGMRSLSFTLEVFEQSKFLTLGAGRNQRDAHTYIELEVDHQIYAIFNGYWHRDAAYTDYESYALGTNGGVACINAIMLEQILRYKQDYPDRTVIAICHWGTDFQPITIEQKKLAHYLTLFGADLVIGHGAHTIQPIQIMNGRPVIFSIGNAVFNSDGEFSKYRALPFGLICRIHLQDRSIQLYPICTDNLQTFWQPKPVNTEQFSQAKFYLTNTLELDQYKTNHDALGHYLKMSF